MTRIRSMLVPALAVLAVGAAAAGRSHAGPYYSVVDLGPTSNALVINNSGQVGGTIPAVNGREHAFLYSNGQVKDLGYDVGNFVNVRGINASGTIIGTDGVTRYTYGFASEGNGLRDLGSLSGGAPSTYATAINDGGQIVGFSNTTPQTRFGGPSHAFLISNGGMQDLGTLGGTYSSASAINNSGLIVGSAFLAGDTVQHAFLSNNGGPLQDLGALSGPGGNSAANAINAGGQVVGNSTTPGGSTDAVLFSGGTIKDLSAGLNAASSNAFAINASGQVLGTYKDSLGNTHGFLYSGGVSTDITAGAVPNTNPEALNSSGQVVGKAYTANFASQYGFLYIGGVAIDLSSLIDPASGFTILDANGINDSGQIVASGTNRAGQREALLLTPGSVAAAPEPSTAVLAATGGLAGLGYRLRRRNRGARRPPRVS